MLAQEIKSALWNTCWAIKTIWNDCALELVSCSKTLSVRPSVTQLASQSSIETEKFNQPAISALRHRACMFLSTVWSFLGFVIFQGGSSSKGNITNTISMMNSFGLFQFFIWHEVSNHQSFCHKQTVQNVTVSANHRGKAKRRRFCQSRRCRRSLVGVTLYNYTGFVAQLRSALAGKCTNVFQFGLFSC